jgi:acyl-CoA synthetase (AMP-forming)/AMP-acid ligase II
MSAMTYIDRNVGTIWDRWCENASKSPDSEAIVHYRSGEVPSRWSWGKLISDAERCSEALTNNGIQKGEVCAIIARHNAMLYPLYMACVRAGAIPAVLAYPNPRLHPDKFREGLEGMGRRSGLDWILTERALEDVLQPLLGDGRSTIRGLQFPFDAGEYFDRVDQSVQPRVACDARPSDPLLLQHSSGTTGLQKPVLLSHGTVLEHVVEYGKFLAISTQDKVVSWLPLYHDMGLIAALHLPLALGIPTIQIDPFEWVLDPSLLLQAVSAERATVSWLPNFAFSMMADKIKEEDLENVALDSWRMVINCSEPVRHTDQEKFFRRFANRGLRRNALSSCYAMAETTFAVTQTPPGSEPNTLAVDPQSMSKGEVHPAANGGGVRVCVSSGQLIPGCHIRIVDKDCADLGDRRVGEVLIKSATMFDGYRSYPEKTAAAMRDGWYLSGDYGFKDGCEYYIIGRKKDVVIIAGNNIYPEDVEAIVNGIAGVIPGRVVAFGEEDTNFGSERLSVIAETPLEDEAELRKLRMEIKKAGMAIDLTITNVYLVAPRFLVKSSAGKPSRSANKERVIRLKEQSNLNVRSAEAG